MLTKQKVFEKLKQVNDPELGVNIVDLGLVYDVTVKNLKVTVTATLTSPFCPLGPTIVKDIEDAVMQLDGVEDIKVKIVFTPPWTKDKMTQEAKDILGVA